MPIIAEIFGASDDALSIGLVITIIGAAIAAMGKINALERKHDDKLRDHEREDDAKHSAQNTRLALVEQRLGLDTKKSGIYPSIRGEDE